MNSYKDFFADENSARSSRGPARFGFEDVLGDMIAATVFGLTRSVHEVVTVPAATTVRKPANDDLILEANGWR
jgi:hypothetical protein